ncbi:MAG TPA: Maf family protein [Anaerolineales bacterium]|nr:Maf family protein [Anaerolineales bacterium]
MRPTVEPRQPTPAAQTKTSITLASASPRRQELLALTGWPIEVRAVRVDEEPEHGEDPRALVKRLAQAKLRRALARGDDAPTILAADTIVVHDGQVLGKPADEQEAQRMLLRLRGKSHQVFTALALVDAHWNAPIIELCETTVPMRDFADAEAEAYVRTGSPLDKAGAYGIQDGEFNPVALDRMHGCYANVMGLPICHLVRAMRRLGHEPAADVPAACQAHTGYVCDVFPSILEGRMAEGV